jgi:F-type H+-transporting ATPase subunit b
MTLAVVLGLGFRSQQTAVHAQTSAAATTPEGQPPAVDAQQERSEDDAYLHSPTVVKLGRMMGMDAERSALAFQLVNFVLLAAGIGFVAIKVIPQWLRDRGTTIQKNLVGARTATEEARARLSTVEERLSRLDSEIAAMRTQAEQDAGKEERRIKATVEEEKARILAAAVQEISAATMHAQKQLQQHAAELAIEQAARKLVVSAETDRLLVQGFAQRLTGDESKKGQN